jgi:hypothetical protein
MAAATGSATASAGDRASGAVRLAPSTGGYYNPVAPSTQTARLLTVLVEFNPNANDDVSGCRAPGRHRLGGVRHRATRIVDADGNPLDSSVEDLSLGVEFEVRRVAGNHRWVVVGVHAARADNTP